ncbi:hypothetical protein GIY62_00645 [Burkholderia plantarii]|uniref:hypothetical protein n=1 Tax=Burkholderia plantarii TaxID=41899 RepID=UPI00272ACFBC|nr:hypothetical protein [Burkholderia plantarii]WLE59250.1 hypothetical protein GIY62_00645 [Burkholderia plantarii]
MQVSPQQSVTNLTDEQSVVTEKSDRISLFGLDFQTAYRVATATARKGVHGRTAAEDMAAKIRTMARIAGEFGHAGLMITLTRPACSVTTPDEGRRHVYDVWRYIKMDLAHSRVRTYGCAVTNVVVATAARPTLFVLAMHAPEHDKLVRATVRAHADLGVSTTETYSRAHISPFDPAGGLAVEFFAQLAEREGRFPAAN